MSSSGPTVAVVGAGVIGLAIARELALRGARVTVIDRQGIGAGTSTTTFAWVNAHGKTPDSYHVLNAEGMHEHDRLQSASRSDGRWFVKTGTYQWAVNEEENRQLQARVDRLLSLDYAVRQVGPAELKSQVPELRIDRRVEAVWWFPEEGYVWPQLLLARLWAQARENGATLWAPAQVIDIAETNSQATVTLADGQTWTGDLVVSAAGRWSAEVMALLGKALAMTDPNHANPVVCGILGHTSPLPVQLHTHLMAPGLAVRPDGGGRMLLQALDLDDHADPAYRPDPDGMVGQTMLHRLQALFENTSTARIEHLAVGQRSLPADGHPGVGFVSPDRRIYLAVTHSGITLGPLLGRLVAEELIDDQRSDLLADYQPDRLITH